MAFKFVILSTILAVASAGYLASVPTHYAAAPAVIAKVANPAADAVALTHQNVVRSFGGTVSQYSKSIHTPYSSVHKEDTRVNNNVYTPTVAKTITYAAPVAAKTLSYAPAFAHSAPVATKTVYAHQEPTHALYASSAPHTVYTHEQPSHTYYASPSSSATVFTHQHEVPIAAKKLSYAPATTPSAPVVTKNVFAHQEPTRAVYASSAPHTVYTTHEQPSHTYYASPTSTAAVFTHQHKVPVAAKTVSYAPAHLAATHSTPVVTKTVYGHQEPTRAIYASSAPHTVYTHHQPSYNSYASPTPTSDVLTQQHEVPSTATTTYNHGPAVTTYTHSSPAVSAYGSSQKVQYSPADMVSHMSFDGFGTHWGF